MSQSAHLTSVHSGKRPLMQMKTDDQIDWSEYLHRISSKADKQAFQAIFHHFAPLLKSFFLAKFPSSANNASVDELIQEVMLKVWQKAYTYDATKSAVSTWIFTLARNTYIDMFRRSSKYANTTSLETEDVWEDDTDEGPFSHLQYYRESHLIKDSLKKLPEDQATVIRKVYLNSKTHAEVADEMKLPLGTVKSRVRLGLNKLGTIMNKIGGQS